MSRDVSETYFEPAEAQAFEAIAGEGFGYYAAGRHITENPYNRHEAPGAWRAWRYGFCAAARPGLVAPPNGSGRATDHGRLDSAVLEKSVVQRNEGLPFAPIGATLEDAPPDPSWLWTGYLAPGAVTLLAGRPKVGKSTLLFALLAALRHGSRFLSLPTRASKVLLLSEERPGTLEEKRRAWQLDDGDVHLLMRHQAHGFTWAEIVPRPSATATRKGSAPSSSTRSPHGAACERTRRTAQAPSTRFCGR